MTTALSLAVDPVERRKESTFGGFLRQRRTHIRNGGKNEITKTRGIDQDFREIIKNDRVYTCEKHFLPENVEIYKSRCFMPFHDLNTRAQAWLSKGSSASFSLAISCYFTPF